MLPNDREAETYGWTSSRSGGVRPLIPVSTPQREIWLASPWGTITQSSVSFFLLM